MPAAPRPGRLTGQVVLIAGIGTNMGFSVARRMLAAGARVVFSDIRPEVLDLVNAQLAEAVRADRSDATGQLDTFVGLKSDTRVEADCERLVQTAIEQFGSLDVLVNCTGRSSLGPSLDMSEELFSLEIQTNLVGNFLIARAAGRSMVRAGHGGRIILFGSGAGESAYRGGISHCAAKAGVNMIAKVMAIELGEHGITVNVIAPGFVPKDRSMSSSDYRDAMLRRVPLGRAGVPDDVAGAIEFLASADAAWISGVVFDIDGGAHAGSTDLPYGVTVPRSSF